MKYVLRNCPSANKAQLEPHAGLLGVGGRDVRGGGVMEEMEPLNSFVSHLCSEFGAGGVFSVMLVGLPHIV